MTLPNSPSGWGKDDITRHLDGVRSNSYAMFHNLRDEYQKLVAIDKAFRKAVDSLNNTKDWFAALFLLRAHSSFLGGVQLAMGGHVSEGNACLRLNVENALYGFYFFKNPASRETWLARHDSDSAKKKVRDEFTIRILIDTLNGTCTHEAKVVEALYNQMIDCGAHPNEKALMQAMQIDRVGDKIKFQVNYLTTDTLAIGLILESCARVGICCLSIFQFVYRERFDIVGLSDSLSELRKGL